MLADESEQTDEQADKHADQLDDIRASVLPTETSTQRTFFFIQSVGLSWLTLAWRLGPVVLLWV